jgi:hypothetical protein
MFLLTLNFQLPGFPFSFHLSPFSFLLLQPYTALDYSIYPFIIITMMILINRSHDSTCMCPGRGI